MKKILSIVMSICMLITSVSVSLVAFADDDKSVTVTFGVVAGGMFTLEPQEIKVTADLSDKYVSSVGYNDTSSQPTILDAVIAAHIAMFGEDDFQPDLQKYFKASSATATSAAFGETTNALMFKLNAQTGDGNGNWYDLNTNVNNGDYIDYYFYQDAASWSDVYTYFNERNITAFANQEISLTAMAQGLYDASPSPAKNYDIVTVPDGDVIGKTDENGVATLSFDKAGTYAVSTQVTDGTVIVPAYCKIEVKENPIVSDISNKMQGGAKYLLDNYNADDLTVEKCGDYLTFLNSGYDVSAYKATFLASVDKLLADNGKLTNEKMEKNALAYYAGTILCLDKLGLDPTNYKGFDLVSQFKELKADQITNPYYYRIAVECATEFAGSDFAKKIVDQYIKDYYTMGRGMKYWGFSTDNTANFLTAIAEYKDDYKEIVADALAVLDNYTVDNGFLYMQGDNTASPDSTACALMAYSALGDLDRASICYNNLIENFENKNNSGVFQYCGEDSIISTKSALLAFEYFDDAVTVAGYDHILKLTNSTVKPCKAGVREYKCATCDKTVTLNYKATEEHNFVLKDEKAATPTENGYKNYVCSVCGETKQEIIKATGETTKTAPATTTTSTSQTEVTKIKAPKKTSIKKVKGAKKAISVTWKKVSGVKGYQVQVATNKKFKKNKKTVTVKKQKTTKTTVKKLKAKKKYYVRVRTYKIVNGKKVYSSWSKVKSVKTK